jgi:hypothetical protein
LKSSVSHALRIDAELIFQMHPKIRCVTMATEFGEPVFLKMREGTVSLLPEEMKPSELETTPQLITRIFEKYEPWFGSMESLVVYYERIVLLVIKFSKSVLILTFEQDTPPETIKEIANAIKSQMESHEVTGPRNYTSLRHIRHHDHRSKQT